MKREKFLLSPEERVRIKEGFLYSGVAWADRKGGSRGRAFKKEEGTTTVSFLRARMLFVHQDGRACTTAHISIGPVNEDDQEDTECMPNSLKNYKMLSCKTP